MPIKLITGVPGSGKTYYGAKICKEAHDDAKRPIYTNINLRVDYDENLNPLDVNDLFEFATNELNFHKTYKDTHTDVRNYDKDLKDSGLLEKYGDALIIWDECQNDLQDRNEIWLRFFAYHRHFGMDIWLITQNLTLVDRKYKSFIDTFHMGQNPAKRIFSTTLRYKVYTDSREYSKFFVKNESIPMTKEIQEYYDSGHYETGKTAIKQYFLVPLILIPLIYVFYSYFFSTKQETQTTIIASTQEINNTTQEDIEEDIEIETENELGINEETRLIYFLCSSQECSIKDNTLTIPTNSFISFIEGTNSKLLYMSKINQRYSKALILTPNHIYDELQRFNINQKRSDKDEKIFGFDSGDAVGTR